MKVEAERKALKRARSQSIGPGRNTVKTAWVAGVGSTLVLDLQLDGGALAAEREGAGVEVEASGHLPLGTHGNPLCFIEFL